LRQPAVILGGYFSRPSLYEGMRIRIEEISGQPVRIVPVSLPLWSLVSFPSGWKIIRRRLEDTLSDMFLHRRPENLTLIGHSIGGILLRLCLPSACERRMERKPAVKITRIITLGAPHHNNCRVLHGGLINRALRSRSGRYSSLDHIPIICVAGRKIKGDPEGSPAEKRAARIYEKLVGRSRSWGDGIVPVSSALLPDATPLILEDVGHSPLSPGKWYGSPDTVDKWWSTMERIP